MMTKPIKHLLIAAGTHGNEWTGVAVLRWLDSKKELITRPSFRTSLLLSNPEAIAKNRRYMDRDLNRCFQKELLEGDVKPDLEVSRAREIMAEFGSKGKNPADLVVDLHTTTAATGPCVILSHDSIINLHLARWLSESIPHLKVALWNGGRNTGFLKDAIPHGLTFEIGPIAQGTLKAETYLTTQSCVLSTLDFIEAWNNSPEIFSGLSLDLFEPYQTVDYPKDKTGTATAMLHQELDGADFKILEGTFKAFMDFNGESISIEIQQPSYPMFVGEASYYEKNVAFYLMTKRTIELPPHPDF